MKNKYILSIVAILLFHCASGQTNNNWFFEDSHPIQSKSTSALSQYIPYGNAFTPNGDLRVLIICAGFGALYNDSICGDWATGSTTLPSWISDKSIFYNSYSDFSNYSYLNNKENISRFYYEM